MKPGKDIIDVFKDLEDILRKDCEKLQVSHPPVRAHSPKRKQKSASPPKKAPPHPRKTAKRRKSARHKVRYHISDTQILQLFFLRWVRRCAAQLELNGVKD